MGETLKKVIEGMQLITDGLQAVDQISDAIDVSQELLENVPQYYNLLIEAIEKFSSVRVRKVKKRDRFDVYQYYEDLFNSMCIFMDTEWIEEQAENVDKEILNLDQAIEKNKQFKEICECLNPFVDFCNELTLHSLEYVTEAFEAFNKDIIHRCMNAKNQTFNILFKRFGVKKQYKIIKAVVEYCEAMYSILYMTYQEEINAMKGEM